MIDKIDDSIPMSDLPTWLQELWETKPHIARRAEKHYLELLKQVKNNGGLGDVVESKSNEKAALKHAVDVIYFADNSDYLSGLYGVVSSLTGLDKPSEEDIKKLFKELNAE